MQDQPTFEHVGSGFEANNYPHRRTEADQQAANAESASAANREQLMLPPVVREIAVQMVQAEAVIIPVNGAAETKAAL